MIYPEFVVSFGSTTPNYQGMFLRGHGSQSFVQNNGLSVGNTITNYLSSKLGIIQGDATRNISGNMGQEGSVGDNPINGVTWGGQGAFYHLAGRNSQIDRIILQVKSVTNSKNVLDNVKFDSNRIVPTANENRPVNIAVKYLIRVSN